MTTDDPQPVRTDSSGDGDIEGNGIRSCPNCGYDLSGLPAKHRCPECGFLYDPHAVVIELHGKRFRGGDIYGLIALLGGALFVAILFVGGPATRSNVLNDDAPLWSVILKSCAGVIWAVTGLVAAVRSWRRWGAQQALWINEQGLQFIDPDLPSDLIPWKRIDHAECDNLSDALLIKDEDGREIFSASSRLVGLRPHVEHCVEQINELRDVYRKVD